MIKEISKLVIGLLFLNSFFLSTAIAHPAHSQRIKILSERIELEPEIAVHLFQRGDAYLEDKHWELAEADFLKAKELDPNSGRAAYHLAKLWQFQGDSSKALEFLESAIKANSNFVAAKLFRAEVFASRNEFQKASKQISDIIAGTTAPLPDLFIERDSYLAQDPLASKADRIAGLRQGVDILGPLVIFIAKIVELEKDSGNYKQAIVDINKLPQKLRSHPRWLITKGSLLNKLGRTKEAKAVNLEAAQRIDAMPKRRQRSKAIQSLSRELESGKKEL